MLDVRVFRDAEKSAHDAVAPRRGICGYRWRRMAEQLAIVLSPTLFLRLK